MKTIKKIYATPAPPFFAVDYELSPGNTIKILNIIITTECNYKCDYCCFYKVGDNLFIDPDDLDEGLRKIVKFLGDEQFIINILGGEPTIHPRFLDLINIFGKYKTNLYKVTMASNFSNDAYILLNEMKKILGETHLYVYLSLHPRHFEELSYTNNLKRLTKDIDRLRVKILVDPTQASVEDFNNMWTTLKLLVPEVDFIPLLNYVYDDEYKTLFEIDGAARKFYTNIEYSDGSTEQILSYTLEDKCARLFNGLKCDAMKKIWVIHTDCSISFSCKLNEKYELSNYAHFFMKLIGKDFICTSSVCCNSNYTKWMD